MGIVTQAALTSLRTLKYGSDQPGGGNSGEPYVTQAIPPAFKQQVASTNIWNSDSGLIRGGFTGATYASALDTARIGKFLVDPPRGPLFIAKQVGLQLSNPQLETAGFSAVGPTRIYNLGINTLAQVPVNAFGGHIVRHGLTPVLNEGQKYASVVVAKNIAGNNRLVALKNKLVTYPNANIAYYVSGPGSVDGIGTTLIKRYDNTLSNPQYNQYINLSIPTLPGNPNSSTVRLTRTNTADLYRRPEADIDYYLAQGVSEQYFNYEEGAIATNNNILTGSFSSKPTQIDQNVIDYAASGRKYDKLISTIDTQISGSRLGKAYPEIYNSPTGSVSFVYTGKSKYNGLQLAQFNLTTRVGLGKQDQVNLIPLFESQTAPGSGTFTVNGRQYNSRDLIKFRVEAVDGSSPTWSTWMVFRALLKNISDNPNPTWNTINYVGRGEPFYIYKGFERTISFEFQVAAMSEEEMKPMWQKLNYLYSNTMPDYTTAGVMRGPYMKLTLGNYLYRQPGVIKSLTYTIDNNSPWEIAIDNPEGGASANLYELPHVMTVQMTFAPVHDFLPRKFPTESSPEEAINLPAFVTDNTTTADNPWLTSIFNNSGNIPYKDQ